jgi:hypothetical protein
MIAWVRVWGNVLGRRARASSLCLAFVLSGCIDDFDDPHGYGTGPSGGGSRIDCSDICEADRTCSGVDDVSDCKSSCAQVEPLIRQSGCKDEWDDALDCFSRVDDICTAQESCSDEAEEVSYCLQYYCESHLDACSDGF